ncbi:MAG: orotate phosphoribosyltransferase [Streptosporangiaceae bacterium]
MTYAADVLPAWEEALNLIKNHGHVRREEPFKLASGQYSHDYVDGKLAIDTGPRLRVVSTAMIELAQRQNMHFTHVGGLTMGADPLAHGIAIVAECGWFSVRKEPKPRGREQWIEGSQLKQGHRVLLVDDVVTTGGSIRKAYDCVIKTGAEVIGVMPMVDRGEVAGRVFTDLGVSYAPLVTYKDIGIDPVG